MKNQVLPGLPPDIAAALEAERRRPDLPPEIHQRLAIRIRGAIAAPPPPPSSDGPGTGLSAAAGKLNALAIFAAGIIVGGVGGAALHAALTPAAAPVAVAPPVAPPPAPVVPERPASRPPAVRAPVAPAPPPQPVPRAPADDAALGRERALLEIARTALARGNAAEALAVARRHGADFPEGRLAEEREALVIQALLTLGEEAEARNAAEQFHKRHPESMVGRVIDGLLDNGETEKARSPQSGGTHADSEVRR